MRQEELKYKISIDDVEAAIDAFDRLNAVAGKPLISPQVQTSVVPTMELLNKSLSDLTQSMQSIGSYMQRMLSSNSQGFGGSGGGSGSEGGGKKSPPNKPKPEEHFLGFLGGLGLSQMASPLMTMPTTGMSAITGSIRNASSIAGSGLGGFAGSIFGPLGTAGGAAVGGLAAQAIGGNFANALDTANSASGDFVQRMLAEVNLGAGPRGLSQGLGGGRFGMSGTESVSALASLGLRRDDGSLAGTSRDALTSSLAASRVGFGELNTLGEILKGQRQGGFSGSGDAINAIFQSTQRLSLERRDAQQYLQIIAEGTQDFLRTGIPINPESVEGMATAIQRSGLASGGRAVALARGAEGMRRSIAEQGPRNFLEDQILRGVTGHQGAWDLESYSEGLRKLETNGVSEEVMRNALSAVVPSDASPEVKAMTFKGMMDQVGMKVSNTQAYNFVTGTGGLSALGGTATSVQDVAGAAYDQYGNAIRGQAGMGNMRVDVGARINPLTQQLEANTLRNVEQIVTPKRIEELKNLAALEQKTTKAVLDVLGKLEEGLEWAYRRWGITKKAKAAAGTTDREKFNDLMERYRVRYSSGY